MAEKARYPFKAYPRVRCETALFCGCALPSQYPRTTDALAGLARGYGAGVVYDCCGKPLEDWGRTRAARRIARGIARRLERIGCRRLVVACPSCLAYLGATLDRAAVECVSVFEQLEAWGFEPAAGSGARGRSLCPSQPGALYIPCPDRAAHRLENGYRALDPRGSAALKTLHGVPCCGLRADVAAKGPQAAREAARRVLDAVGDRELHTYCAACAGQFARAGARVPVRHVLSAVLGVDETPDVRRALFNRAVRTFDSNLGPARGRGGSCSKEPPC